MNNDSPAIVSTLVSTQLALPLAAPSRVKKSRLAAVWRLLPVWLAVASFPFAMQSSTGWRILLAISVFLPAYLARGSSFTVMVGLSFLALVGGLRRWLIPVLGVSSFDPLLLVFPLVAALYFISKAVTRKLPYDTRTSRFTLWLIAIMAVQIFNPAQGSLAVGLGGALFYLGSLFWFYIGRDLCGEAEFRRVCILTVLIAVPAAIYGTFQVYYGFLPSEQQWIREAGYGALNVSGIIRPFSFFTSASEYAVFLAAAIAILWAALLKRNIAASLPIPLLAVSLFLEASRTPLIVLLAACATLLAIQGRSVGVWIPRLAVIGLITIAGMTWSLRSAQENTHSTEASALIAHQAGGLLNPGDETNSTAAIHQNMIVFGFMNGIAKPLGSGLGSTTLAATRFGSGLTGSTELDFSDMMVALGLVGGLLYIALVFQVLATALSAWNRERSLVTLALLAVLLAQFGGWMLSGRYSTGMLVWLCIGMLDGLYGKRLTKQAATEAHGAAR